MRASRPRSRGRRIGDRSRRQDPETAGAAAIHRRWRTERGARTSLARRHAWPVRRAGQWTAGRPATCTPGVVVPRMGCRFARGGGVAQSVRAAGLYPAGSRFESWLPYQRPPAWTPIAALAVCAPRSRTVGCARSGARPPPCPRRPCRRAGGSWPLSGRPIAALAACAPRSRTRPVVRDAPLAIGPTVRALAPVRGLGLAVLSPLSRRSGGPGRSCARGGRGSGCAAGAGRRPTPPAGRGGPPRRRSSARRPDPG
jgi:hypothetical protein